MPAGALTTDVGESRPERPRLAMDRIAAGWERTIGAVRVRSISCVLAIGQRALRQPARQLFGRPKPGIASEFAKIVTSQMHGQRGWTGGNRTSLIQLASRSNEIGSGFWICRNFSGTGQADHAASGNSAGRGPQPLRCE